MIFAKRIISSHTLKKQTRNSILDKIDRPSIFDNKVLSSESKKSNFNHSSSNFSFYNKSLRDEFRTHFSFNFNMECTNNRIIKNR